MSTNAFLGRDVALPQNYFMEEGPFQCRGTQFALFGLFTGTKAVSIDKENVDGRSACI